MPVWESLREEHCFSEDSEAVALQTDVPRVPELACQTPDSVFSSLKLSFSHRVAGEKPFAAAEFGNPLSETGWLLAESYWMWRAAEFPLSVTRTELWAVMRSWRKRGSFRKNPNCLRGIFKIRSNIVSRFRDRHSAIARSRLIS